MYSNGILMWQELQIFHICFWLYLFFPRNKSAKLIIKSLRFMLGTFLQLFTDLNYGIF